MLARKSKGKFGMATQTAATRPLADPNEKIGSNPRLSAPAAPASPTPDPALPKTEDPGPLRAAHTPNFPALLRQLGASLLVTTYQAGKLVMVRDEGDHLNTHYRAFKAPMGLALADGGPDSPLAPPSRSGSSATTATSPAAWNPPARTTPASCRAPAMSPATS